MNMKAELMVCYDTYKLQWRMLIKEK